MLLNVGFKVTVLLNEFVWGGKITRMSGRSSDLGFILVHPSKQEISWLQPAAVVQPNNKLERTQPSNQIGCRIGASPPKRVGAGPTHWTPIQIHGEGFLIWGAGRLVVRFSLWRGRGSARGALRSAPLSGRSRMHCTYISSKVSVNFVTTYFLKKNFGTTWSTQIRYRCSPTTGTG